MSEALASTNEYALFEPYPAKLAGVKYIPGGKVIFDDIILVLVLSPSNPRVLSTVGLVKSHFGHPWSRLTLEVRGHVDLKTC